MRQIYESDLIQVVAGMGGSGAAGQGQAAVTCTSTVSSVVAGIADAAIGVVAAGLGMSNGGAATVAVVSTVTGVTGAIGASVANAVCPSTSTSQSGSGTTAAMSGGFGSGVSQSGSGTTEAMSGGFGSGVSQSGSGTTAAMSGGFGGTAVAVAAPPSNDGGGGGGGSGSVICTELCRTGKLDHATWVASMRYTNTQFSAQTMNGYHMWGVPYVNMMRKSRRFARWAKAPTTWFAEDNAYRMGERDTPNIKGMLIREMLFRPICWSVGIFAKARDWQGLWNGVSLRGLTGARFA